MRQVVPVIGGVLLIIATVIAQSSQPPLRGVWRVAEVRNTGPNASTNTNPQPGVYIFTDRHYSVVRVASERPRPTIDPAKASVAEVRAVYDDGFIAQSGTYEVSGTNLTIRRIVAKSPAVMAPGTFTTFTFSVDGKTLTLTSAKNETGAIPNPQTVRLTRLE